MTNNNYKYTKLAELQTGTDKINIFGVVKYCHPPKQTRSSDYNVFLTLIDPSIKDLNSDGVRVNLFASKEIDLPDAQVGDIIRFHRVKCGTFNNRLQVTGRKREFQWILYDHEKFDVNQPTKSSSTNATVTEETRAIAQELHEFFLKVHQQIPEFVQPGVYTEIRSVVLESYFNCIVQVLTVHFFNNDDRNCCLLRVCDGSKTTYSSFRHEGLIDITATNLTTIPYDFVFEISLFDDHLEDVRRLKAGDFVEITNVHSKRVSNEIAEKVKDKLNLIEVKKNLTQYVAFHRKRCSKDGDVKIQINDSQGWIELVVHSGKNNGRGIKPFLPTDSTGKDKIDMIRKRIQHISPVTQSRNAISEISQAQPPAHSSQQTYYTKIDFPFRPITNIQTIYKSPVPNKYRLKAKVLAINPIHLKKVVKGKCPSCSYVLNDVYLQYNKVDSSTNHMQCPNCVIDILDLFYSFKLLVMDDTGLLEVHLPEDTALVFFNKIRPKQFLEDIYLFSNIHGKLKALVGNVDGQQIDYEELPIIDLCVYSYTKNEKVMFNLFGTSLI